MGVGKSRERRSKMQELGELEVAIGELKEGCLEEE